MAAGDSKNWGRQEENQHGILQQTASYYIIAPYPMKSGGWEAILYGNKTICFQKEKPLSCEKDASLKTFSIYILFLNKEVLILAMEWF